MLDWLLDSLIRSVFIGSIYVLASLGLTLTLAVVKLPNFAHAEFLTIGGYVAVLVSAIFPNDFVLMGAAAFFTCGIMAIGMHYAVYKPMIDRKMSIYTLVLASFAAAIFVRYSVFVWASIANLLAAHPNVPIVVTWTYGSAELTNIYDIAIPLALVLSAIVGIFLTVTTLGKSMRAVASNLDLARITGIKLSRVVNTMWFLAGGLAGVGGVLLGVYSSVTPVLGYNILLQIFAVVIIAGLTSMSGTVIGGYVVGFSENTLMDILHNYFGVSFLYKPLLPFALVIVVLLFKPTGLTPNALSGIGHIRKWLSSRKTSSSQITTAQTKEEAEEE